MFCQRECNWLQALEGDIDTSHFGFLHVGSRQAGRRAGGQPAAATTVLNRAPEYHVTDTDWGTMYGAYRPARTSKPTGASRISCFPFWTQRRRVQFADRVLARAWVPMDDHHTMFVIADAGSRQRGHSRGATVASRFPARLGYRLRAQHDDWYGRWRPGERRND